MGQMSSYAGIVLLASGCGHIVIYFIQAKQPEFKAETQFFEKSQYEPPTLTTK